MSRARVVDEHRVRAAAGLTMAVGTVAFAIAVLDGNPRPIRVVSTLLAFDFALRVVDCLERSPTGIVAGWLTRWRQPLPVSARPKRFASTLGLVMSASMAVVTNAGVRGLVPRTICAICLALMWAEACLGLCIGCELHGALGRRGWIGRRDGYDVCASGACDIPAACRPQRPTMNLRRRAAPTGTERSFRHGAAADVPEARHVKRSLA